MAEKNRWCPTPSKIWKGQHLDDNRRYKYKNPTCSRNNLLCFRFRLTHFPLIRGNFAVYLQSNGQGSNLWIFTPPSPIMFYNVEFILRGNFIIKIARSSLHKNSLLSGPESVWNRDMFLRFVSMDFNVLSPIIYLGKITKNVSTTAAPAEIQTRYLRNRR